MKSKGDGVSKSGGVLARTNSSKQGGEPAVADSRANKVGTPEISGEPPPHVGRGQEGRASSSGLGARGRLRHPVRRRGRTRWHTVRSLRRRSFTEADACAARVATAWQRLSAANASADACAARAATSWQWRSSAKAAADACAANAFAAAAASLQRRSSATVADSCAANTVAAASVKVIALPESNPSKMRERFSTKSDAIADAVEAAVSRRSGWLASSDARARAALSRMAAVCRHWPFTAAACRRWPLASAARAQQSSSYRKRARSASRCRRREVWRASRMRRRWRQSHRKMVLAATRFVPGRGIPPNVGPS
jgi:hypothetical protein